MADETRRKAKIGSAEIGSYFQSQNHGLWLSLGLVLLLLIAAADYATGFKLRLSVLYLVPILIITWAAGWQIGIMLSFVACTARAYTDVFAGRYIDSPKMLYWDWGAVFSGYILLVIGISVLRHRLEGAHFQSRKDTLTGLVNKGGFYQVVGAEMELCRRYERTLSIAYIDLDNFKKVNDKYGHHVGDKLLRTVSKTMQRKLRGSDIPGRLGGDEFAVILPETSPQACRMVIEMLQQRLLQEMNANNWPVTFSIGIATFTKMPSSIEGMIRQADHLMYVVKNSSKGAIKQEVFGS